MKVLFVNACMREGSRTEQLAKNVLAEQYGDGTHEVTELKLGTMEVRPLDTPRLARYNAAVESRQFDDKMFDFAKQFAQADEIVIAAPLYNYAMPAQLHAYLELVCTQGITFDVSEEGKYYSLCQAKRLTYVSTSGGVMPFGPNDHAFGYVQTLAREFWNIQHVSHRFRDSLDVV